MKKGWVEKELGEVCKTTSGGTPSRRNKNFYMGDIPWVKSGELNNNTIYDTEEHISKEAIRKSSAKIFPKGTLLIALYGATIGKLAFLGLDAASNQAVCAIFKNKIIDSQFLFYYLFHKRQELVEKGTGGAQPNISQTILKKLSIKIAPLPEQRAIVAKIEALFSELDNGIANLQKAQAQLKIYRQAVLKKAFEGELTKAWRSQQKDLPTAETLLKQIEEERAAYYQQQLEGWKAAVKTWEAAGKVGKKPTKPKKLQKALQVEPYELNNMPEFPFGPFRLGAYIGNIEAGKSFRCEERPPSTDEIGVAKVSAVTWGEYNELESKTCQDPSKINPDYFINKGDFLISRANTIALVGTCVIVKRTSLKIMLSDKTLRIKYLLGNPYFFLYYLRSRYGRKEIENKSTGNQESMRNIGQNRIKSIIVPLYSPQEQEQIVQEIESRLSVCDQLEATIKESLDKAAALRQSILKKAFEGRLLSEEELAACRKEEDWEDAAQLLERIKQEQETEKKAKKKKTKKKK